MDDDFNSKATLNFKFENVEIYDFSEIEAMGKNKHFEFVDTKPDEIFTLVCKSLSDIDTGLVYSRYTFYRYKW